MAVARAFTFALWGLDAKPVTVEVDVSMASAEKGNLIIVGLPDSAVKEAKDRVSAALKNSGYPIDNCWCVVNLAPAPLRKEGARYDLAIAIALLRAKGILRSDAPLDEYLIAGELSLSGDVRPINGVLPLALLARQQGHRGVVVPKSNQNEGATVQPLITLGVSTLRDTVAFFNGQLTITPAISTLGDEPFTAASSSIDMSDIRGQEHAKRALEIAAAGNHNMALSGPPGTGKSMLARSLIGIMPPLTLEEALETTQIHSVAQLLLHDGDIIRQRPFRAPHHTISYAGLIGGGAIPRPGEVSLAHNGVLFLDELPEFGRPVLEVLRQPLEDHVVTVSRARGNVTFPSRFLCITAMNPCPCGYRGHPSRPCRDTEAQVSRYYGKISGPLWDRLDLHIQMSSLSFEQLHSLPPGESSATVRDRVIAARQRQYKRNGKCQSNGLLSARDLRSHCQLDSESRKSLQHAVERLDLSARAADKLLRISLTIADLAAEPLASHHILEALTYRMIL